MSVEASAAPTNATTPKVLGCVKFFDKRPGFGFGFISVLKNDEVPEFSNKDVFVHYSGIRVENQQYKYLVKGEYVEFYIAPVNKPMAEGEAVNVEEKFNAIEVRGIQGGKLMCETNYVVFDGGRNGAQNSDLDIDVAPRKTPRKPMQKKNAPRPVVHAVSHVVSHV